jgi:two-component system, OmpR family, response regulator MprA
VDDPGPTPGPHPAAILVVEDDPDIRELVRETLRDEGFRVVAATNHTDALVALTAMRFGLILTDTAGGSAVASGDLWDDLDRLRAAAGDTPTLIFSAHDPTAFDGYAARGFAGFIAKPFALHDLLAQIRGTVRRGPTPR